MKSLNMYGFVERQFCFTKLIVLQIFATLNLILTYYVYVYVRDDIMNTLQFVYILVFYAMKTRNL